MIPRSYFLSIVAGVALLSSAAWVSLADPLPAGLTCTGACGRLGPDGVVTAAPSGSATYFYVTTSGGLAGVGQLPGVGGVNGSLLQTDTFFAAAGSELQYYFNYVTSDGAGFQDYAFSQLIDSEEQVATLFSARTRESGDVSPGFGLPPNDAVLTPATTQVQSGTAWSALGNSSGTCFAMGCGHTGWVRATYIIPADGTYRLRFGISNFTDSLFDSGLAFDGFTINGSSLFGCVLSAGDDDCLVNAATDQAAAVDALAGTDTLRLGGTSDFTFDVSKIGTVFTNFELFAKSGTSTVTLTGTAAMATNWTVAFGKLIAGGPALANDSRVSVLSGAQFALNANTSFSSLEGAGGLDLGSNILTVGASNASTLFSGLIEGSGRLVKTGSGLLTLSGGNTFSGGIDVLHGGIRLGSNTAAGTGPITTFGSVISYGNGVNNAAPIVISSNTTQLEVLASDSATQSGAISETGGVRPLEKIGSGTLVLSGSNTYTGATTISAGTLVAQGGNAISNGSSVVTAGTGTFGLASSEVIGSFAGSGGLQLASGTVLTTGGNNASTVFSGTSSGLGGMTKAGSGVFSLSGANSFAGPLTVSSGTLSVLGGGSLAGQSAVTVQNGAKAFLGGAVQGVNGSGMSGTGIGSVSVNTGGTVYLDDNTTLSVTSANVASGAGLNLFLTTNTSQYGSINASGAVSVGGATVGVYLDPITFSGTTLTTFNYANVTTGSSVSGTFGSVNLLQAPNALFSVTGVYSSTSAGVRVTRSTFSTLGGGGSNQGGVGGGLETIFTSGTSNPDIINLFSVIGSSPSSAIPAIYAAISGAENAENTGSSLRTDDPWKQSVAERVNAARATGCTVAGDTWCLRRYAQATTTGGGEVMSDVLGDPTAFDWLKTGIRDAGSTSAWGRVIAGRGETTGDANGPGSTQLTGGFIGGADRVLDSLLLAGMAVQYVETEVAYEQSRNGSLIRSGQVGAYVSYGGAEAYLNGNVSVIGSQASANRFMSIGLLNYNIESLARSWAVTASMEAGTIMEIDGYRFEPSFALNFQSAHPLDFTEKGGGGLSLVVRPEDTQSLRSILSARVSRVFDVGDRKLVPQLRVDWRHEMLDRRQEFSAAFAAAPSVFFDIDGASYARDVFAAGASLTMPITGRLTGYVDAQGALSKDSKSAMVSVGGRWTW